MVDKQQFFLPCFVVCAIFSAIITAQSQVDTDPREILVTEGQRNVSLLCRLGRPIQFCTIAFPNSKQISLKPGDPQRNGLTYFGAGLEAGACGVTIDRITTAHNGALKCTLFSDESYEGFINVVVAVAPKAPHIQLVKPSSAASFEVDTDMEAHCDAEFGNPAAELFWFLDDEPIYEGVSQPEYREEEQGYSSYVSLRHRIRASDSGKRLICRAKHVAYPEGMSETSLQITVNYAPQALPETTVHSLTVGRTVDVTITIQSNPAPQVAWTVDGMTIEQGQEHERYAARVPERQENGGYNVTLTIAGLTLEDLHKRYHLRASNQIGSQDYTIQLSADQAAAVDESSGVGVGGIIGIVLAALIVLVAIALIIMARATGRWCFRGKASSTTTSNARIGESSDTESAEVKQPITKTQRLKILFGRKRAELGEDDAAGGGEEIVDNELVPNHPSAAAAVAAGDDNGGALEDYATVDPGAPKRQQPTATKDEPAMLVYAELQLKPAENSYVAKPAESTEYAEILYVPNGQGGSGPVVVSEESSERPSMTATTTATTKTGPSSGEKK